MGRPPKRPPEIRLEILYVPASEADAKYAVSAFALMYRHVMLRNPRILAGLRRMEALAASPLP